MIQNLIARWRRQSDTIASTSATRALQLEECANELEAASKIVALSACQQLVYDKICELHTLHDRGPTVKDIVEAVGESMTFTIVHAFAVTLCYEKRIFRDDGGSRFVPVYSNQTLCTRCDEDGCIEKDVSHGDYTQAERWTCPDCDGAKVVSE